MDDKDDEAQKLQDQLNSQQDKANADIALKLKSLTRQRMDIVKGMGAEQWTNPDAPTSNPDQL